MGVGHLFGKVIDSGSYPTYPVPSPGERERPTNKNRTLTFID